MRMFVAILAITAIAFAGTAMAADVSQSTLAQMGMQNMQKVSDAEGMAIRGMGYAIDIPITLNRALVSKVDIELRQNYDVALTDTIIPTYRDGARLINDATLIYTTSGSDRPAGDVRQNNLLTASDVKISSALQKNEIIATLGTDSVLDVRQLNDSVVVDGSWTHLQQRNVLDIDGAHTVKTNQRNILTGIQMRDATAVRQSGTIIVR